MWDLVWLMSELHDGNVQHNDLSIDNIMLHWKSYIRVECKIKVVLCINVRMLNHFGMWNQSGNGKLEKWEWRVTPKLFRVHSKRHQVLLKYYTKEVESFMVRKLAKQLCNQGHNSIVDAKERYKFWTMTLEHLCKVNVRNRIHLSTARCQIQMDLMRLWWAHGLLEIWDQG